MIRELKVWAAFCDHCGRPAPCCQLEEGWHEHEVTFHWNASDADVEQMLRQIVAVDGWTENGEGIIHCTACPPLELTDEAKAERAREKERTGLALFDDVTDLEGTTP